MPDYIFMLESRLSPEQLQALNQMQQEAQELSLNLYLVGGAVRDLMTGSPIRDLDFVVEGNPLRLAKRVESRGVRRLAVDPERRTAEMILADGVSLSLEMARTEFYQAPGKPAQVSPAPILEDLRRRDFSTNAMGISLTPGSRGLLLDPTNGLGDIENRELRVLNNYSFVHDPLRLLRLVRFTARLGFRPEPRTKELFETALERGYQDAIPPEALGRELSQIAREANAVAVLKALAEHDLLAVVHPFLQKRKPDYDGLAKLQKYCQQAAGAGYRLDPVNLALHYILRRLKPRLTKQLLGKVGLKTAEVKQMLALEMEARRWLKLLGRRTLSPRQVYQLLDPVPVEMLVFVLAEYSDKKKVQAKIYNFLFKYRPLRQRLPVRELQLMGVQPGAKFDQILEKYFEAQLDGKLRSRPQQLRYLRTLAGLPKPSPKPAKKEKEKEKEKEKKPATPAAPPLETKPPAAAPAKLAAEAPPAEAKPAAKLPAPPPSKIQPKKASARASRSSLKKPKKKSRRR
jgi:tRNA nucleotidyltransferase/poly(A) polymerase